MKIWLTTALIFISTTALAEEISGRAHVVDGDSLRIAQTRIELKGVDAPEARQTCRINGHAWACGETATKALRHLVGGKDILCSWAERDSRGRALAICYSDGNDIGATLVYYGIALADRQDRSPYSEHEALAKAAARGVWGKQFVPPWDWRRGVRLTASQPPDADCPVKGHVTDQGRWVYHVKDSPEHAKVTLKPTRGDACFRNVADAELAGFRKPEAGD